MFIRAFTEIILLALGMLNFSMAKPDDSTSSSLITAGECTVYGKQGSYAYIEIINKHATIDGFVRYTRLDKEINSFLNLSATNIDVWADGISDSSKRLTTSYKGEVEWKVGDESIISFDDKTFQITGLKPGTTTITATADGMSKTCTVHSIYKWPQSWVATTNSNTDLYEADGNGYKKSKVISEGQTFTVYGDDGSSDGWAYGKTTIAGNVKWGFVPISHISTKGTISQYNELGWIWPINSVKNGVEQSKKATYITSPYGWRDDNPVKHKGMDITNGVKSSLDFASSVDGYEVVSAFAGKVIFTHDNSEYYRSCGNCVAIRSNEIDPVTGKYFVAIYMHLKHKPEVSENQNVSANELLGYVGNTGNSAGSHLHFEVNNQNLSYGQKLYYDEAKEHEKTFSIVINPLFFYMDYYYLPENSSDKIIINPGCAAMNYRKPFWYGDDVKETPEP